MLQRITTHSYNPRRRYQKELNWKNFYLFKFSIHTRAFDRLNMHIRESKKEYFSRWSHNNFVSYSRNLEVKDKTDISVHVYWRKRERGRGKERRKRIQKRSGESEERKMIWLSRVRERPIVAEHFPLYRCTSVNIRTCVSFSITR